MNEANLTLGWIPLFPLVAALWNLVFGRWIMRTLGDRLGREVVHLVAIGAVAFSCFYTFSIVFEAMVGQGYDRVVHRIYPWIVSGETMVGFDLMIDHLSAVMCMVVTGVGLLIHIFSVGYMAKDGSYWRYFAYLNLFMAAMLILVMGKSLVLTFVGWEGVGLCSYLLIGYYYDESEKASAGRKAFIVNRIGDFGVILGMLLIYAVTHSLDYDAIKAACAAGPDSDLVTNTIFGVSIATAATMLLFVGCTGKSAQLPLYTWLPDAMAGPTPVSALIHAATMVTAGVYLIVRLNPLFALSPITMSVVALIGALTALFAATIGITQNDIKKVLAYSTVSQLGYMFLAAGMGAWGAAVFHLVTHAFFKACLFLGSGAVIEACHHNQDIRTMGGLRKKMPWTAGTFLISCLAIAGIPIFAGFFSKDEILLHAYTNASAWSPGLNYVAYALGLVAAACTAFYMFRLYFLTFEGKFRGDHHTWEHHVHEQWIMSFPLVVLAILATFGGFLGVPHVTPGHLPHVLDEWLHPITQLSATFSGEYFVGVREGFADEHGHVLAGVELGMMALSVGIAVAGILFARSLYKDGPSAAAADWAKRLGGLYRASLGKYFVDEIYDASIVRPVRMVGGVAYQVGDQLLVDGVGVGGVSWSVGAIGNRVRIWHNGNVRRYLAVLLIGVAIVLASVFANPTVTVAGPNPVHPVDAGGLRPTLGAQPIHVEGPGFEFDLGPDNVRRPGPPPQAAPVQPPSPGDRPVVDPLGGRPPAPQPGARGGAGGAP
ncbi:MAG: NADH-quinone oxidoreductase subunit L [Deltaproteobacteria bacterium]|nr:NADH-quinone oxidoreductase subunit L [Deltaproteobacteria bacterium]MBK8719997.1 NADH-quinone oxidoreductase subunit L [Deltaproteobacteria bacterium]MBP7288719.1 NADH-quinone oxidoreductase subunit L [Nannocystaceae bacterium]